MSENYRTACGVLTSQINSRDIKIENFSLLFHHKELLRNSKIELNMGRRYGLIGINGSGKSTFLNCIAYREAPIPDYIDIFHLDKEIDATNKTALEAVIDVNEEKKILEKKEEELLEMEPSDEQSELLEYLYERMDELDTDMVEINASKILHGLGFNKKMQQKKTKEFSGGWRMRISLARALLVKPSLLLLDEPTNHLDLDACIWLENYLSTYNKCLVVISHSQEFMNNVCNKIIHLHNQNLEYYTGNFDQFVQTRKELEDNQMKQYNWEQDQIKNMKNYIAKFGHGSAKLAKQAHSKERTLEKMIEKGLTEKVTVENVTSFSFPECENISVPVLQVDDISFHYKSETELLYDKLNFSVDLDTRIAIVGSNGVGKSTFLKLINGDLQPTGGFITKNHKLRIAFYNQHLSEELNPKMSAIEYILKEFEKKNNNNEIFKSNKIFKSNEKHIRGILGRFGITGESQKCPMGKLSDGQKSRIVFAWMSLKQPHILLLDEPTNHLDIETIDILANAINNFKGGVVLVSHDFRLIQQVAKEIWICKNKQLNLFKGDILDYKKQIKTNIIK